MVRTPMRSDHRFQHIVCRHCHCRVRSSVIRDEIMLPISFSCIMRVRDRTLSDAVADVIMLQRQR